DLQQVAAHIGMNYSSFTKAMQEGDYVYIKRENLYYKFVRDENFIIHNHTVEDEVTLCLKENFELLKAIVTKYNANDDFSIDKRKSFNLLQNSLLRHLECQMDFQNVSVLLDNSSI
ncbi:MAG: hypothetical protein IJX07_04295, partial [Bacillales bacterium]|nr:hypothetical protein [Bacillales bacterium]